MSGWKVTSLFGSLINWGNFLTVNSDEKFKVVYIAVLGDDIDLTFESLQGSEQLFSRYDEINFPISASKTFTTG